MSDRVRLIGWCTFLVMLSLIPLFITSGRWIDFLELTMFLYRVCKMHLLTRPHVTCDSGH